MATEAAAVFFHDGRVYWGIYGSTPSELMNNTYGAGIDGGSPFELTDEAVIMTAPNGSRYSYTRDGTTWWANGSIFTPDPGPDGGQILPKY